MLRITLGLILFSFLSGCAAITGARGDAKMAQQTAAVQNANSENAGITPKTITSPTMPPSVSQQATKSASQQLAPLH